MTMTSFVFEIPGKVYFGEDAFDSFTKEVASYGRRVMLLYGGGSIKKNGIYKQMTDHLDSFFVLDYPGVEPNPKVSFIDSAALRCIEEKIEVIVAVGGGSVIDCAKGIAAAVCAPCHKVWPLITQEIAVEEALPVIAVLTNAATGSEMDAWAVISNEDTKEKLELGGRALIPKASFEVPSYSYSVSSYQTACGAFDILSHVLDYYYFALDEALDLQRELQEAVMRTVVRYAPIAIQSPQDAKARANLMWASSLALNGILDGGTFHEGVCHLMEHELSAHYKVTHGEGLAIVMPRWLRYSLNETTAPAIYRLGVAVFQLPSQLAPMDGALKTIKALEHFAYDCLGLKASLDVSIYELKGLADHCCREGRLEGLIPLETEDVYQIYIQCTK